MARAIIHTLDSTRRLVLTETTLIGRHWSCAAVVDLPRVPLYWLEIRWTGSAWAWRCLGRADDTRGPGSALPDGWRRWPEAGRSQEIRLADAVSVRIVDAGPPEPVLEQLSTGMRFELDEILDRFVVTEAGVRQVGHGGEAEGPVLEDGAIIELGSGAHRLWAPHGWAPTVVDGVDLQAVDCTLDVHVEERSAVFTQAGAEARIEGAFVTYLAAYALARRDDPRGADAGYRENPSVHLEAVGLGANAESPTDRVNWERARVRTALIRAGARGVDQLFERRRIGAQWTIRLNIAATHLTVTLPGE